MAKCIRLQRKDTRICAGSLNRKIDIYTRELTAPSNPSFTLVDYDETFTLLFSPWSMIQDVREQVIFNDISIDNSATHNFYIRFVDGITQENWIVFKGDRFDILKADDLDENRKYLILQSVIRGADTKDASKS